MTPELYLVCKYRSFTISWYKETFERKNLPALDYCTPTPITSYVLRHRSAVLMSRYTRITRRGLGLVFGEQPVGLLNRKRHRNDVWNSMMGEAGY